MLRAPRRDRVLAAETSHANSTRAGAGTDQDLHVKAQPLVVAEGRPKHGAPSRRSKQQQSQSSTAGQNSSQTTVTGKSYAPLVSTLPVAVVTCNWERPQLRVHRVVALNTKWGSVPLAPLCKPQPKTPEKRPPN